MKNYIKIVFIYSFLFFLTSVSYGQNKLKTGFYYLADKQNEGELIGDIDSEDKFAVNKKEILTIDDFSDAKLELRNMQPDAIKVIVVKLTKNGRKKWAEIKTKISTTGESIVFIYNDKIYLEKRIIGKTKMENSIDLFLESKYVDTVFQVIKSETATAGNRR